MKRIAILAASAATAGILGFTGVANAGDYDGDYGGDHGDHHRHHGNHHDGWDRDGWGHDGWGYGRCGRDRGLIGNLLHELLGRGC
jgi:hypothetical protein